MWKFWSVLNLFLVLLIFSSAALVAAQGSRRTWQTLGGNRPLVIARGGFSGLFADSSSYAYSLAVQTGLDDLNAWCDVQLTRDGTGICFPDIRLDNASDISSFYGNRTNTYVVNGVPMQGWFALDFTIDELGPVNLLQRIYSRAPNFDQTRMPILTVDDVVGSQMPPPGLWLNVPYAAFFNQHNLSLSDFIITLSRRVNVSYISSPEVNFLRNIGSRFRTGPTRLVLQIPRLSDTEPTTNQTYESLLSNLTFVRTFASGIMVPKSYIFPVAESQYLQRTTLSRVQDAHTAGLLIFASNFANDASNFPYDYNYDPVVEYLSYVDNGNFSVDGVLSDFPITPSATIDCFAHIGRNAPVRANVTVISNEGASGVYPGCTNRAYTQAVSDEADILDCPVQITTDGIPFCMGSINLMERTNVATSNFSNLASNVPELNIENGIFTYNLTWSQIQNSLRPQMNNPSRNYSLFRNPAQQATGSFIQLSEFLDLANNASSVSGVLIGVEHARYLAENQGLDVIGAVLTALNRSGNPRSIRIMIQSSDSAVLSSFMSRGSYEGVYVVNEDVSSILNSTISDIRNFAASVVISKDSVYPSNNAFLTGITNVVPTLQAFGLQVYVRIFRNEFVTQAWDFFSDPYVELNTFVSYMGINGVITDFPGTAARYKRNRCLGYTNIPPYMLPVLPGGLLQVMVPTSMPPAEAPNPVLTDRDVAEPALPPVLERRPPSGGTTPSTLTPSGNGQTTLVASAILSSIPFLLAFLTIF